MVAKYRMDELPPPSSEERHKLEVDVWAWNLLFSLNHGTDRGCSHCQDAVAKIKLAGEDYLTRFGKKE